MQRADACRARKARGGRRENMQSALHGMIEKAHRYATEPDRVRFERFEARVRGNSHDHAVSFADGQLACNCEHFQHEGLCAHVLTVEKILRANLPANAAPFPGRTPE
jgi:hypothetical protein